MPDQEAESLSAPASSNEKTRSPERNWFHRLASAMPKTGRLLFWMGVTGALTMGMRAANHIFSAPKGDTQANVAPATWHRSGAESSASAWWAPSAPPDQMPDLSPLPVHPDSTVPSPDPAGKSIIPVDRSAELPAGKLALNSPINIGVANSREAYAILGLGRSSSPSITGGTSGTAGAASAFGDKNGSAPVLHFSLAGNLNLVPVDNLATSGTGVNIAAVPEPTTGAMVVAGLGSLLVVRRRQRAGVA